MPKAFHSYRPHQKRKPTAPTSRRVPRYGAAAVSFAQRSSRKCASRLQRTHRLPIYFLTINSRPWSAKTLLRGAQLLVPSPPKEYRRFASRRRSITSKRFIPNACLRTLYRHNATSSARILIKGSTKKGHFTRQIGRNRSYIER